MDIIITEEEYQAAVDEIEADYREYRAMLEASGIFEME